VYQVLRQSYSKNVPVISHVFPQSIINKNLLAMADSGQQTSTSHALRSSHPEFPVKIAKIAIPVADGSNAKDDFKYKEKLYRPITGFNAQGGFSVRFLG